MESDASIHDGESMASYSGKVWGDHETEHLVLKPALWDMFSIGGSSWLLLDLRNSL
jgi:hypothetical protein